MPWALNAQRLLAEDWGVAADVWSVTSWTELRRDALAAESHNLLNPGEEARVPYVTSALSGAPGPVVAVSDWMRAVPDQIARWVPAPSYTSLGTDGFGFSDTRPAARRFFHVDAESIVLAVLSAAREDRRGAPVAAGPGDHEVQAGPAGVGGARLGRAPATVTRGAPGVRRATTVRYAGRAMAVSKGLWRPGPQAGPPRPRSRGTLVGCR